MDRHEGTIRIAMWSGPRNISTAMMRSFANRPDCTVIDEPFYAAFLKISGLAHPMRDQILAGHESNWRKVARSLTGPAPDGSCVLYQKHMTHHMLPGIGRDWMGHCRHAFLIRHPARVLASYASKRDAVTFADNDRHTIAETERLGAVVAHEDHRSARLGQSAIKVVDEGLPGGLVQSSERLVQEEDLRLQDERAGQAGPLRFATGQGAG